MARFVNVAGRQINADAIESFRTMEGGALQIVYKNGEIATPQPCNADNTEDYLRGKFHVVQVIPCAQPLYAVWEDGDRNYSERVDFLGLCADGEVVALPLADGCFYVADTESYYKGIYNEREMLEITSKECETEKSQ